MLLTTNFLICFFLSASLHRCYILILDPDSFSQQSVSWGSYVSAFEPLLGSLSNTVTADNMINLVYEERGVFRCIK